MLYTLNLQSAVCQLYFNKTRRGKKELIDKKIFKKLSQFLHIKHLVRIMSSICVM